MSSKNSLLTVGLTALGLFGVATRGVADPAAPIPPGQSASAAPSPTAAVLLLTNGAVQQGLITEEDAHYVLHCRGGKIPVPKAKVEKVFRSIEEVYRYKADLVPARDPDEHMKLARWCLTNRLPAEAKAQLQSVLALSPQHGPARAMFESLVNAEERAAQPRRDSELVQSGGSVEEGAVVHPEDVNAADLRKIRSAIGISDTPRIFDLPPALAVKRANEFARYIHPVLQTYCARCHNEQYSGRFQLVPSKGRRDRNPDVFRANLDATLQLIDPSNPSRSELLSSSLVPHGSGANKRPIFRGANDPAYQILSAWVSSLSPPRPADGAMQAGLATPRPTGGEGFATDRGKAAALPLPLTPPSSDGRPQPPPTPNPTTPLPPGQLIPGSASGTQPYAPEQTEFPVPYMLGGPKPQLDSPPGSARPPVPATAQAPPNPAQPLPNLPAATPLPPKAQDDSEVEAEAAAPKKKPRTPLKIDDNLLQRTLMNRYAHP